MSSKVLVSHLLAFGLCYLFLLLFATRILLSCLKIYNSAKFVFMSFKFHDICNVFDLGEVLFWMASRSPWSRSIAMA